MRVQQTFVILLLLSIPLAGCLENSSSTSSAESTNSDTVLLDVFLDCSSLEINTQSTTHANGSVSETIVGVNASLYHAMYSVNTTTLSIQYDIDLDGMADYFNYNPRGTTTLEIPMSSFVTISQNVFLTTIGATASTANGEQSELVHISNDCAVLAQIDLAHLTVFSGDFSMYDFEVRDASDAAGSANGGDNIVYVSLESGEKLSWSAVIVQMSANDSPFVECTNPDKAVDTGCAVVDNGDGEWAFGEEVTIKEGSDDLCGTGTCTVAVKVLDRSTNKLIYESTEMSV